MVNYVDERMKLPCLGTIVFIGVFIVIYQIFI